MSQRNPRKQGLKTVRGYVVQVPNKRDGSDDEEDDEDEEDSWLDHSEIKNAFADGAFVKQQKKPRYCRVILRDLDHQHQTHSCFGGFVVLDPWWEMTVTVDTNNRVQGLTQYRVRQDKKGIVDQNLVPFLLNTALRRCFGTEGGEKLMEQLEQLIRIHNRQKLIFEDIEPLLYQFMQAHPEERKAISQARYHDSVQAVLRGQRYPDLLCFLCRLFPFNFLSCLLTPKEANLAALEEAASIEPWVFGFKTIMASRFRVYGLEAGYRAFEACGLMPSMPRVQKDALYIYEILKSDASHNGHTYLSFADLHQHRHWADLKYGVKNWASALTFLATNGVTVEERFDSRRNVFLYHNWKSEMDIARGLEVVMNRAIKARKPPWDVNFTSPDLSGLQRDGDQWLAAQKVVGGPVCVMSGKGGCGKTTVITQLMQHVCQQSASSELAPDNVGDLLPRTELHNKGDRSQSSDGNMAPRSGQPRPPPPAQVTEEQLSRMIQTATQALEDSQAQKIPRGSSQEKRKQDQLQVELTSDLIKYLCTTGDTALSRTPNGQKILLTAPTGKAAKLLGHKARMESCTLHRIIYSYRTFVRQQWQLQREDRKRSEWGEGAEEESQEESEDNQTAGEGDSGKTSRPKSQGENRTQRGNSSSGDSWEEEAVAAWKYSRTEVLVVDECSLVSLRIFATLLNILVENTPLSKVVLLGDIRQLPSIQPGNFLGDMFATFRERGLSVELRTNHRSESELIVTNATRISQRQVPIIDPGRHFHFIAIDEGKDSADPERDAAVRQLLMNCTELASQQTSQFVAFRRIDCDAINELCCMHYNHHTTRDAKSKGSRQPYDFRLGDKICFRKNGQVLNQGLRLRGYLQNCPDILETFGISSKGENPEKKKRLDAMAAAEQVLKTGSFHDTDQPSVSVKQEKPWKDEHGETDEALNSGMTTTLTRATARDEQTKKSSDDYTGCAACPEYHTQTTDFGKSTEDLGSLVGGADVCSTSAAVGSLRLGDMGAVAENSVVRDRGPSQDNTLLGSGQDKEEEQRGKLKDGQVRLCNGEVFFIMDDVTEMKESSSKESRFLTLSDRDPECPRVVCVSYQALKRECRLHHSWARTIHTYQGSESDTVVYYVGASRMQNWKHVYTAVTRGRKSVLMVGKESELRQAVGRWDRRRHSRLSHRLSNMMKGLSFQELHAVMCKINEQARVALQSPPTTTTTPHPPMRHQSSNASSFSPDSSGRHVVSSPSAVDAFPDSDDSWVRDMSPVWAADYQSRQSCRGASHTAPEESKSSDTSTAQVNSLESLDLFDLPVDWDLLSPMTEGQREEETKLESTPKNMQRLFEGEMEITPDKKGFSPDPRKEVTHKKQQHLREQEMALEKTCLDEPKREVTPKKKQRMQVSPDPIDGIVSPVRKTLNI